MQGQEEFLPGMEFYSALVEGEEKGSYQRYDYCAPCWTQLDPQKQHPKLISSWKSKVPIKKLAEELPKQRDARVLVLLKEAILQNKHLDEAFVLALYLARKRLIALRQEMTLPSGDPASLYEVLETEEMLCVPRLRLSGLQVEKIQQSLAAQLKDN
jgi:hypothetical protein